MDLFDRQWSSYRAILQHDLMEHRAVADATAEVIEAWLASQSDRAANPHLVDLGCGDLALLAPLLKRLPLASYTGLDLAAAVLPLAEKALGEVRYPSRWCQGDLLAWAEADHGGTATELLHSAFAIHHLDDEQKHRFLVGARRRIHPDGVFIWVDVFRNPGESRQTYLERYVERIGKGWSLLSEEQRDHVITHMRQFDQPADRATIAAAANAAGWHWQWHWQGQHQAEAMAVLRPA